MAVSDRKHTFLNTAVDDRQHLLLLPYHGLLFFTSLFLLGGGRFLARKILDVSFVKGETYMTELTTIDPNNYGAMAKAMIIAN